MSKKSKLIKFKIKDKIKVQRIDDASF
jgi:hypothetical protein